MKLIGGAQSTASLTHWPLGWLKEILDKKFSRWFQWLVAGVLSNCPQWIALNLTDNKSTLVQVTAWCRQATSHYLSQWWPRSLSPYGVTRPQWVNSFQSSLIHRKLIKTSITNNSLLNSGIHLLLIQYLCKTQLVSQGKINTHHNSELANNRDMTMSSNGEIFCITGPLCGEFTSDWWILLIKASDMENGDLMFSLICAWTNDWANNWDAGDLRRYHVHYDITVMDPLIHS